MLQRGPQKAKRQLRRRFAENPLDRQGVDVHLHLVARGRLGQSPRLDAVRLVVDHPPPVRRVAVETIDESLQVWPFGVGAVGRPGQQELDLAVDLRRGGDCRRARRGQKRQSRRSAPPTPARPPAGDARHDVGPAPMFRRPGRSPPRPTRHGPVCPARAGPACAGPAGASSSPAGAAARGCKPPLKREKEYCRRPVRSGGIASRNCDSRPRDSAAVFFALATVRSMSRRLFGSTGVAGGGGSVAVVRTRARRRRAGAGPRIEMLPDQLGPGALRLVRGLQAGGENQVVGRPSRRHIEQPHQFGVLLVAFALAKQLVAADRAVAPRFTIGPSRGVKATLPVGPRLAAGPRRARPPPETPAPSTDESLISRTTSTTSGCVAASGSSGCRATNWASCVMKSASAKMPDWSNSAPAR